MYKARKILDLKYSTAKQIVNYYKKTGKIDRTNAINKNEKIEKPSENENVENEEADKNLEIPAPIEDKPASAPASPVQEPAIEIPK